MKKTIHFIFSFLVLFFSTKSIANTSNGPIVSPIGIQSVIVGGKIDIYFTAVGPDINYFADDLPPFAELVKKEDNDGIITINTNAGDEGIYTFHLQATGVSGTTIKTIQLEVKSIPEGATVYYSDPINGETTNAGDSLNPWGSLQSIFAAFPKFEPGDVIFCRDGLHGKLQIFGNNEDFVTIAAQSNHSPTLQRISIIAKKWIISGFDISPENAGLTTKEDYVNIGGSSREVFLENCSISSIDDANEWTVNQDWYDKGGDGIQLNGKQCVIRNNFIKNTFFPITIEADNNRFEYNIIDRFAGDAMRGLASDLTFAYNVVKNAVVDDYSDPGGNHDDAFQSWAFGPPKKNIILRGNQMFHYTDPDIPLLTSIMQGIVDFDGFEEGWIVENNLVVQDHPHGIALFGAKNCKVINNTVVRSPLRLFSFQSDPWINVHAHKDGRKSSGNLVRNNIMGAFEFDGNPGTKDFNKIGTDYANIFADYENWDFHLKTGSEVIDAGIKEDAPTVDNDGLIREIGNSEQETPIDLGCFETNTDIFDLESPSSPTDLIIKETSNSSITMTWKIPLDNVGISFYEVTIDRKTVKTTTPSFTARGLKAATDYDIEIRAVDFSNNKSEPLLAMERTSEIDNTTFQITIPVHQNDHQIKSTKILQWVGLQEHQIGGVYSTSDGSAVYPFALPLLEEGMEVKSVDFILNYNGMESTPSGNVDVYALPFQKTSDVSGTFHWQGTFGGDDAIGTPIMDDFTTPSNVLGQTNLDSNSTKTLATFINEQITNGAKTGDYFFLRLNTDIADEKDNAYYKFSSADANIADNRPFIVYSVGEMSTPTKEIFFNKRTIEIYPNPLSINQELTIKLPQNKTTQLNIVDVNGRLIWTKTVDSVLDDPISINMSEVVKQAGVYFIQVMGGERVYEEKVVVY